MELGSRGHDDYNGRCTNKDVDRYNAERFDDREEVTFVVGVELRYLIHVDARDEDEALKKALKFKPTNEQGEIDRVYIVDEEEKK